MNNAEPERAMINLGDGPEEVEVGPDVDLDTEDVRLSDGTRLTQSVVNEIVRDFHREAGCKAG